MKRGKVETQLHEFSLVIFTGIEIECSVGKRKMSGIF